MNPIWETHEGLRVINRQRFQKLQLKDIAHACGEILSDLGVSYELGIAFVGTRAMADANQRYLQHSGSTDVITFDYGSTSTRLHGDLLISVPDAWKQALEFQTSGEAELLRYVIHGMLHLQGFDDQTPSARRQMKVRENQLVRRHLSAASSFLAHPIPARKRRI